MRSTRWGRNGCKVLHAGATAGGPFREFPDCGGGGGRGLTGGRWFWVDRCGLIRDPMSLEPAQTRDFLDITRSFRDA